jgi:iron complex outermembrane receptor protein
MVVASAVALAPLCTAVAQGDATGRDITALPLEALLDLEIYSASRFAQKTSEAPSAARVITSIEIRAQGWRTLAEALASLPGLYTSYDRTYSYLGARGFLRPGDYDSRFLLLVDGVRVNDPVYDQAPIGTDFLVDMRLVDRIEYVPGPGSSAFGSNAFFGVINVVTRRGSEVGGAVATVEAGSLGQLGAAAQYGWTGDGGRDLLVAASRMRSDGDTLYFREFDTPGNDGGIARGLDHGVVERLFVKASAGNAALTIAHAVQVKGDPTASYDQLFGDPRSEAQDARTIADLAVHGSLSPELEWTAHVFAGRYDYRGTYVYAAPPGPLNYDTAGARWAGVGVQAIYTGWAGHKVVAGFDGQRDIRRDLGNYDRDPDVVYLDQHSANTHLGPFIQDEIEVRDDLRLNLGLRFDHATAAGSDLSPRAALIYAPSSATTFKALLGSAYRAPNSYETSYTVPGEGGQIGNANLGPERIRTSELVWSQRIAAGTTMTASLFRYDVRDLVSQVLDEESGLLTFANHGRVTAKGLEVALDHVWGNGARARASYSFADVDDATGQPLQNSPRALVKLGVIAPLSRNGLLLGLDARYVGSRIGEAGRVDPYAVVDIALHWPVARDHVELAVKLRNLLDERYGDPPGPAFAQGEIEQDGRSVLFEASFRY